jgi:hypothetical protein
MTDEAPPISVRLDPALARALEEYCARTGATRSRVMQESVAEYLLSRSGPSLSGLAEAVLPPLGEPSPPRPARAARGNRYRDYVRAKRRR